MKTEKEEPEFITIDTATCTIAELAHGVKSKRSYLDQQMAEQEQMEKTVAVALRRADGDDTVLLRDTADKPGGWAVEMEGVTAAERAQAKAIEDLARLPIKRDAFMQNLRLQMVHEAMPETRDMDDETAVATYKNSRTEEEIGDDVKAFGDRHPENTKELFLIEFRAIWLGGVINGEFVPALDENGEPVMDDDGEMLFEKAA